MLFKLEAYVDIDFEKGTSVKEIQSIREYLQERFEKDYVIYDSLLKTSQFLNSIDKITKFEFMTKEDILERMRTNGKT